MGLLVLPDASGRNHDSGRATISSEMESLLQSNGPKGSGGYTHVPHSGELRWISNDPAFWTSIHCSRPQGKSRRLQSPLRSAVPLELQAGGIGLNSWRRHGK